MPGRPAIELSDNPEKATGNAPEIERYLREFGSAGRERSPVLVSSPVRQAQAMKRT